MGVVLDHVGARATREGEVDSESDSENFQLRRVRIHLQTPEQPDSGTDPYISGAWTDRKREMGRKSAGILPYVAEETGRKEGEKLAVFVIE